MSSTTSRFALGWLLSATLLPAFVLGCEGPDVASPVLGVLIDGDGHGAYPAPNDPGVCGPGSLPSGTSSVSDFDLVRVVHTLPEGVIPIGGLSVTLATACEVQEFGATHANGVARISIQAPAGASCGVVISTTMAGQTQSCTIPGAGAQGQICCPVPLDAQPDDAARD